MFWLQLYNLNQNKYDLYNASSNDALVTFAIVLLETEKTYLKHWNTLDILKLCTYLEVGLMFWHIEKFTLINLLSSYGSNYHFVF